MATESATACGVACKIMILQNCLENMQNKISPDEIFKPCRIIYAKADLSSWTCK